MNTPQDGGPAFPVPQMHLAPDGHIERVAVSHGMSLRDWFAGMAAQGMLANPDFNGASDAAVAGFAYRLADAMIEGRERKEDA